MRTSSPHFDLFARVCDVDGGGASWNVCDALVRVAPGRFEPGADDSARVAVVTGDVTSDRSAVADAVREQDAVLCTLGVAGFDPQGLIGASMRVLVPAMRTAAAGYTPEGRQARAEGK